MAASMQTASAEELRAAALFRCSSRLSSRGTKNTKNNSFLLALKLYTDTKILNDSN